MWHRWHSSQTPCWAQRYRSAAPSDGDGRAALCHLPSHSHAAAVTHSRASLRVAQLCSSSVGMEWGAYGEQSNRRAEQRLEPKGKQGSLMEVQQRSAASSLPPCCQPLLQAQGGHCPTRTCPARSAEGLNPRPRAGQSHLLTPFTPGDWLHGALWPLKAHRPGCGRALLCHRLPHTLHPLPTACPTRWVSPTPGAAQRCWGKAAPPGTAQQSPPRCHR